MRTTISGTGVRLPETIVTNEQLMDVMDIDVDWVVSRTGVEERRIADPGTTASDLAIGAGMAALPTRA
jgi:3-oxoacyl-[acyl-carrier-protein] synthase-3